MRKQYGTQSWQPNAAFLHDGDRGTSRLARSAKAFIREWNRPVVWCRRRVPTQSVVCGVAAGGGGGGGGYVSQTIPVTDLKSTFTVFRDSGGPGGCGRSA